VQHRPEPQFAAHKRRKGREDAEKGEGRSPPPPAWWEPGRPKPAAVFMTEALAAPVPSDREAPAPPLVIAGQVPAVLLSHRFFIHPPSARAGWLPPFPDAASLKPKPYLYNNKKVQKSQEREWKKF
jgi:hypothetical protein